MAWLNIALPIMQAVTELMRSRKTDVAEKAGVRVDTVERVAAVVEEYVKKDETLAAMAAAEMEKARRHDVETWDRTEPFVNLLRGLVRPVVTFAAFAWYVYARMTGLPLMPEDYAIIGGIVAFWFGFRPFDKRVGK
ncbi:MAG: hypothetical protein COY40_03040 [Alphaproteobacteria bacterium CG_4_10_14_0_8_um_filter_53_9]|nr:MAG: hypothetical protein COY40_03040 [Alphaproteobacteria bacterium CG_4_10_14_0_8_um_filter_53_9]